MKKLFEKTKVFLVDRFTARHRDKFEVYNKIITPANVVTMVGIIATWVFALQVTFNVCPALVPFVALIPALSDTVDGKLADMYGHSKWGKIIDIARDYNYLAGFLWAIYIIGDSPIFWLLKVIIGLELAIILVSLYYEGDIPNLHCVSKIRFAIQWVAGFLIIMQYYWVGSFIIPILWLVWIIASASVVVYFYFSYKYVMQTIGYIRK